VTSKSGETDELMSWNVPVAGYGKNTAEPGPLVLRGATALKKAEIASFQVMVTGGQNDGATLVTVPVS
jgi:hypothetical protein